MDFSQADSAAETISFPFFCSHGISDFFSLTKQGKNAASQILQATSLSEKKQDAQPTNFYTSNKNNIILLDFCRGLCPRDATDL